MSLGEIDGFLPERLDEKVIDQANRKLTISHARDIEKYLDDHAETWVLGQGKRKVAGWG